VSNPPFTRLDHVAHVLGRRTPVTVHDPARREAAVALVLVEDPDRILLVRRVVREGDPWSGQMALPGGRREAEDPDLLATAIRETEEEVGMSLQRGELLCALDDLAPLTPVLPPIVVRPFVFRIPEARPVRTGAEVDHAEWVALEALADPALRRGADLVIRGAPMRVMGYHLPAGLLWGMTERIVTPVIAAWRAAGWVGA
jgi:8-oxo-dGTP pyrophosphatase MutT (NUDIX family)